MDKQKLMSLLRKALIVLLTVSAVLLARASGFFSQPSSSRAGTTGLAGAEEIAETGSAVALRPRAVAVCLADGSRLASIYAGDATERALGQFAALLGEALGSAGTAEELSAEEWRAGLQGNAVWVDLGADYPLKLLASWLGGGEPAARPDKARLLCLIPGDGQLELRFRLGDSYYRCDTSARVEALLSRLGDVSGESAEFAFEDERLAGADPDLILTEELPEIPKLSAALVTPEAESLMAAFGMNSRVASFYRETDGTAVLIEDEKTLRIAPDGTVRFRSGVGDLTADDEGEAINCAVRLAERVLEPLCGDAHAVLRDCEASGTGWTVELDYVSQGVPVRLTAGAAAHLSFQNGALRSAVLRPRCFTAGEETETLMPPRFAAAVAAENGGSASLCYLESGDGLRCLWVND